MPDSPEPTQPAAFTSEQLLRMWDDFTRVEADEIGGHPGLLVNALQDKFGLSKDEAARQVQDFLDDGDAANNSEAGGRAADGAAKP